MRADISRDACTAQHLEVGSTVTWKAPMVRPVVHLEVRGFDAPTRPTFYREVVGWERNDQMSSGDYTVAEIGTGAR